MVRSKNKYSKPNTFYLVTCFAFVANPLLCFKLLGSYQCRVGWATNAAPILLFKNVIAKPRKERSKKDNVEIQQTPQLQVGNDISNIEAVRFQLKTQFDRNVVTHFEAQEHVFDYIFTHLGIDSEKCVPHPIVITEAFLNTNSSRQRKFKVSFFYSTLEATTRFLTRCSCLVPNPNVWLSILLQKNRFMDLNPHKRLESPAQAMIPFYQKKEFQ